METIVYRTIAEQVFNQLQRDILSHALPEGTPLMEVSISKKYGVSRGPVREALKELTRFGLISPRGKAGYQVAFHPNEKVQNLIISIRCEIEIFVITAVIETLTENDFSRLHEILEEQHKACLSQDILGVRETDIKFHEYIIKKYDDKHVEDIWRPLLSRMMMRYSRHRDLLDNNLEHQKILAGLKSRDLPETIKGLKENIW